MTLIEGTLWCDGCGVEITWTPVIVNGKQYCCKDCSEGITCECGNRMEIAEEE